MGLLKRTRAAVLVAALTVTGCSATVVHGNGSTGGPSASQPLPTPTSLIDTVYTQVRDSSGTSAKSGTIATLLFQPGGVAAIYLASDDAVLAHHGTWSYTGGTLSLKFTAQDFHPDVTTKLDLRSRSVTLPFQLFSTDKGSSQWRRGQLSLTDGSIAVFDAYASDDAFASDSSPFDYGTAVANVEAYAKARLAGGGDVTTDAFPLAAPAPDPKGIKSVTAVGNGLQLELNDGGKEFVELYGWAAPPATPAPLQGGPLSGDPRVHLNVTKGRSGSSDVTNRNAVFFAPYNATRIYFFLDLFGKLAGAHNQSAGFDWEGAAKTLSGLGFGVDTILNNGAATQRGTDKADLANLVKLIGDLGGKSGKAPGFLVINTHGAGDGTLSTGVRLGLTSDGQKDLDAAFAEVTKALTDAGFGDMLTFDGGTAANPKTLSRMTIGRDFKPGKVDVFVSLTPAFFRWLASKGATFAHSVVYIAACLTDSTPDLRNAVAAGAYLAWKPEVDPHLAGAVMKYLVDDMARPTHSAEEAYYNIIRVANTGQMIYQEDADLQGVIPDKTKFPLLGNLDGYGYSGGNGTEYNGNGFLNRATDPGQIWWLLFASRWGQDATQGAKNLLGCWQSWWSAGKNGGLQSPGCNASDAGSPPKQDEVGYATYLLTGSATPAYSLPLVPRVTLHDGG